MDLLDQLDQVDIKNINLTPKVGVNQKQSAQGIHKSNQDRAHDLAIQILEMKDDDISFDSIWLEYQRCLLAQDFAVKVIF